MTDVHLYAGGSDPYTFDWGGVTIHVHAGDPPAPTPAGPSRPIVIHVPDASTFQVRLDDVPDTAPRDIYVSMPARAVHMEVQEVVAHMQDARQEGLTVHLAAAADDEPDFD